MRAKLNKMLRSIAREHTTGLPERAYETQRSGQVRLIPGCTRAAYKQLKKQLQSNR